MNLHIKSKLVSIHHKMDILDDDDQPVYHVSGKPISLHDKTHITDLDGNEIASIHAKAVSIHHKYFVDMADGASFELSEQLFHIKDIIDIPELGWQLRGSILAFEFQIVDAQERVLGYCASPYRVAARRIRHQNSGRESNRKAPGRIRGDQPHHRQPRNGRGLLFRPSQRECLNVTSSMPALDRIRELDRLDPTFPIAQRSARSICDRALQVPASLSTSKTLESLLSLHPFGFDYLMTYKNKPTIKRLHPVIWRP